jgi:hypothetical protein
MEGSLGTIALDLQLQPECRTKALKLAHPSLYSESSTSRSSIASAWSASTNFLSTLALRSLVDWTNNSRSTRMARSTPWTQLHHNHWRRSLGCLSIPSTSKSRRSLGVPKDAAVIEWLVLRAANRACNTETRRRHPTDMELHTGRGICEYKQAKWFLATRGQKLRTIEAQRRLYRGEIAVTKRRKEALIKEVKVAGKDW